MARPLRDDPALRLQAADGPVRAWTTRHEAQRFNVVYNFYSVTRNRRLFLRVRVGEGEPVPTLSGLFPYADWAEREVYDLFGVVFEGHPDLRRI